MIKYALGKQSYEMIRRSCRTVEAFFFESPTLSAVSWIPNSAPGKSLLTDLHVSLGLSTLDQMTGLRKHPVQMIVQMIAAVSRRYKKDSTQANLNHDCHSAC